MNSRRGFLATFCGLKWLWSLAVLALIPSTVYWAQEPGTWTATGPLNTERYSPTATLLPNGKVLVVGGGAFGTAWFRSAELYDPAAGTFSLTGSMLTDRSSFSTMLLPNGRVLVAGGISNAGLLSSAELYDPTTGTFSLTGSMILGRCDAKATLLPNGTVLVAGGSGPASPTGQATDSAEIYNPATGTWTVTNSMASKRAHNTATLLPTGKVLVAGGVIEASFASAELYDPGTGTWSSTGSMSAPRAFHAATLLPNGKVLVVGGNQMVGPSAELYDPATGAFTATGSMTMVHARPSVILLPSGKVLVVGGNETGAADLYDPTTGTWSPTGGMIEPRGDPMALALLPNGKVLVEGGDSYIGPSSSAELYNTTPSVVPPSISSIQALQNPIRLKIIGNNLHSNCEARINGLAVTTIWKSTTLILAKNCKGLLPKGVQVSVTVANKDDGGVSAPFPFIR